MQAVSNLPISAWLPLADLNGGETAAGCRGKQNGLPALTYSVVKDARSPVISAK